MKIKTINIFSIIFALIFTSAVCFADNKKRRPSFDDFLNGTAKSKPAKPKNDAKKDQNTVKLPGDYKDGNSAGNKQANPGQDNNNNKSAGNEKKNDDSKIVVPEPKNNPKPSSAAEAVGKIIKQRPKVPISRPKNLKQDKDSKLKKDRTIIAKRIGTIAKPKDSSWWVITFEKDKEGTTERSRRIMPSKLLESIEEILVKKPSARFEVIGENYNDGTENYILLRRVVEVANKPKPKSETGTFDMTLENGAEDKPSSDKTSDQEEEKDAKPDDKNRDSEASSSDIAKELLKDNPGKTVTAKPKEKRSEADNRKSVAPAEGTPETKADSQIYSRIVRIVKCKDSNFYEIRFISDNSLRDPPIKILPNTRLKKALEFMQKAGNSECKFIVSGEVTVYKKQRYILLRSIIKQRDMNQF